MLTLPVGLLMLCVPKFLPLIMNSTEADEGNVIDTRGQEVKEWSLRFIIAPSDLYPFGKISLASCLSAEATTP